MTSIQKSLDSWVGSGRGIKKTRYSNFTFVFLPLKNKENVVQSLVCCVILPIPPSWSFLFYECFFLLCFNRAHLTLPASYLAGFTKKAKKEKTQKRRHDSDMCVLSNLKLYQIFVTLKCNSIKNSFFLYVKHHGLETVPSQIYNNVFTKKKVKGRSDLNEKKEEHFHFHAWECIILEELCQVTFVESFLKLTVSTRRITNIFSAGQWLVEIVFFSKSETQNKNNLKMKSMGSCRSKVSRL